jgi:hypothetical protein
VNFRTPIPFAEALDSRQVRQILPTDFRTRLLSEIPAALRERAVFSAGVTNAEFLQRAEDGIGALVSGTSDRATQRAGLKKLLDDLGYQPVPEERDSLTDLSSDARLNLILDTNTEMAFGYGQWKQGQDPAILDLWPAQELVRIRTAKVPRDWPQRWAEAGGEFSGGRMIALKNDPIWMRISRFGLPYPPFDFNSGMDVQDIDRTEAVALGLIDRDTELLPQDRGFNDDLQASPEVRATALQDTLLATLRDEGLNVEFIGGVLKFLGGLVR